MLPFGILARKGGVVSSTGQEQTVVDVLRVMDGIAAETMKVVPDQAAIKATRAQLTRNEGLRGAVDAMLADARVFGALGDARLMVAVETTSGSDTKGAITLQTRGQLRAYLHADFGVVATNGQEIVGVWLPEVEDDIARRIANGNTPDTRRLSDNKFLRTSGQATERAYADAAKRGVDPELVDRLIDAICTNESFINGGYSEERGVAAVAGVVGRTSSRTRMEKLFR